MMIGNHFSALWRERLQNSLSDNHLAVLWIWSHPQNVVLDFLENGRYYIGLAKVSSTSGAAGCGVMCCEYLGRWKLFC